MSSFTDSLRPFRVKVRSAKSLYMPVGRHLVTNVSLDTESLHYNRFSLVWGVALLNT
jgi:hypothetical protein